MLRLYVSSSLQKKNLFRSFFSETEICFDSDQSRFFFQPTQTRFDVFAKNHLSDYFLHRRKWSVIKKKRMTEKNFKKNRFFRFLPKKDRWPNQRVSRWWRHENNPVNVFFAKLKIRFFSSSPPPWLQQISWWGTCQFAQHYVAHCNHLPECGIRGYRA